MRKIKRVQRAYRAGNIKPHHPKLPATYAWQNADGTLELTVTDGSRLYSVEVDARTLKLLSKSPPFRLEILPLDRDLPVSVVFELADRGLAPSSWLRELAGG